MQKSRALDALNVFISDVRDGVGPYLAVFLAARSGFSPGQIGWILAAAGTASLLMVSPAGLIFDTAKSKRALLIIAAAAIALFTVSITLVTNFWSVIALQIGVGVASAFIGPGILAVSAVTVARRVLPIRIARNETFNHAGNFAAAALAGFLARTYTVNAVFILVVVMSVFTILSIIALPKPKTDAQSNDAVPFAAEVKPQCPMRALGQLFKNPQLLECLGIIALYQVANACLLPLAAQAAEHASANGGVRLLSVGIVAAQLTAIPVAYASGVISQRITPRFCLALGFISIIARALIFATATDIHILMAAQIFDGVAAGVLAVAPILWILKIIGDSRHLAFTGGLMASAMGIGAAISNIAGGYAFEALGPQTTFFAFAALAAVAAAAVLILPSRFVKPSARLEQPRILITPPLRLAQTRIQL